MPTPGLAAAPETAVADDQGLPRAEGIQFWPSFCPRPTWTCCFLEAPKQSSKKKLPWESRALREHFEHFEHFAAASLCPLRLSALCRCLGSCLGPAFVLLPLCWPAAHCLERDALTLQRSILQRNLLRSVPARCVAARCLSQPGVCRSPVSDSSSARAALAPAWPFPSPQGLGTIPAGPADRPPPPAPPPSVEPTLPSANPASSHREPPSPPRSRVCAAASTHLHNVIVIV